MGPKGATTYQEGSRGGNAESTAGRNFRKKREQFFEIGNKIFS